MRVNYRIVKRVAQEECTYNDPLLELRPNDKKFKNVCEESYEEPKLENQFDNVLFSFDLRNDETFTLLKDGQFTIKDDLDCENVCSCDCKCTQINYSQVDKCFKYSGRACPCDCKCKYNKKDESKCDSSNKKNECGNPPDCGPDRKGCKCEKPYCSKCPNGKCGQGGVCVAQGTCGAFCQCSEGWKGDCCDEKESGGGGDVHYTTLNGIRYDFHGFGEYWYCLDEENDLGIQLRTIYLWGNVNGYKPSWIGGVAVKLKTSIFTVFISRNNQLVLRLDGQIITNQNQIISLSKGDDVININDNQITIDRKYHSKISLSFYGSYLNLNSLKISSSNMNTMGLCGVSNNSFTDFTDSNGKVYEVKQYGYGSIMQEFGSFWRLSPSENKIEWSWSSSNFHANDSITNDERYSATNKKKRSLVRLTAEEQSQLLTKSKETCLKFVQNDQELLTNCILDVASSGGNETFADSELFKSEWCPTKCNGKGKCIAPNTCECINGWSGVDCTVGTCLNDCGVHGECKDAFCYCEIGWEGDNCSSIANCTMNKNCTNINQGFCVRTNECSCATGFTGVNCSEIADCSKFLNCSG